jgi:5-keto 4-deoxyuronate isomerase
MRPEDLREFRDQQPFKPFRIVLTDGRSYAIPHQDFLYIGRHTIEISIAADVTAGVAAKRIVASPLHVMCVEAVAELA